MPLPAVDSFKQLVTGNGSLKLLSLIVALCVWSFTSISRESHIEIELPVKLRNIPPGYSLTTPPPQNIRMTLAGPGILLDGVRRANTAIILNLRGTGPGRIVFSNLDANLKLPEDIRVTRMFPSAIELTLTRERGAPPEGDSP